MMADISLTGVLIVAAIAFTVPLVLGLAPTLHLPSVVLEIVAGIVVGPAIFGLVEVDLPLQVLALLGLAFLLFLAGLEIDLDRLRGAQLRSAATGFVVSLTVALGIGLGLYAAGIIQAPLLVAIILSSTSLGIVIPVLADAGHSSTRLGQLIIASSSIADFGAIILLSLFFSEDSSSVWSTLLLIGGFVVLVVYRGGTGRGRALESSELSPRKAAGFQCPDQGQGSLSPAHRACGGRAIVRTGGDPRRFLRRCRTQVARSRRDDDAHGLPYEAPGRRLRCLHPVLLRHQRDAARRRSTPLWRGDARASAGVPPRPPAHPWVAGSSVQIDGR